MKRPRARIGIHNLSAEGYIENVRRLFVKYRQTKQWTHPWYVWRQHISQDRKQVECQEASERHEIVFWDDETRVDTFHVWQNGREERESHREHEENVEKLGPTLLEYAPVGDDIYHRLFSLTDRLQVKLLVVPIEPLRKKILSVSC